MSSENRQDNREGAKPQRARRAGPARAVLFGMGRRKSIPHYRLRDPAFFRIFEPMTAVSRTFRKMGWLGESRLVRSDCDRFRSKQLFNAVGGCLDFHPKNQGKSNLLKPNQTILENFISSEIKANSPLELRADSALRKTWIWAGPLNDFGKTATKGNM